SRKLTADEAAQIRDRASKGASRKSLAAEFNVGKTTVTRIVAGESYCFLTDQDRPRGNGPEPKAGHSTDEASTSSGPAHVSRSAAPLPQSGAVPVPSPPAPAIQSKADVIRRIRPYCQHLDDLTKCGGSGREHCGPCKKLMAGEAA